MCGLEYFAFLEWSGELSGGWDDDDDNDWMTDDGDHQTSTVAIKVIF